jgi:hypothetical protein
VAKAQQAAQRAEGSLQRLTQRHGTIDLDEYNRLKAEGDAVRAELAAAKQSLAGASAATAQAVRQAEAAAAAKLQEAAGAAKQREAQWEAALKRAREEKDRLLGEADAKRKDFIQRANERIKTAKVGRGLGG